MKLIAILAGAALISACASNPTEPPTPDPIIKTITVTVPVPVPCPALTALGDEPSYPDSDEVIGNKLTPPYDLVKILLQGRIERKERLNSYAAVRGACVSAGSAPLAAALQ